MTSGIIKAFILTWKCSEKKRRVKIDQTSTDLYEVIYGIPHGNVLGPISFLIYNNYITNATLEDKITCFGNDVIINFSDKSW